MKIILAYILQRLSERSTWVGITGAVTALGVVLSPEHAALIATVGAGVASVVQMVVKDHKPVVEAVEAAIEARLSESKDKPKQA
jgi:hypothetical protein